MKIKVQDLSKSLDEKQYGDKWIALKPDSSRVIAYGSDPKKVIEHARQKGENNPVLTKVPKNYGTYIL